MSSRYVDGNGFLIVEKNVIAKAGVFDYLGKEIDEKLEPEKIYKVYRSFEELKKSAPLFEGMPIRLGHKFVTPEDTSNIAGSIAGEVVLDEPYLRADIKIFDKNTMDAIEKYGIVDLSPGYHAIWQAENGEYNGEKYEYVQKDISYNHLAIVNEGRSGKDVKIADMKYSIEKIGDEKMEEKENQEKETVDNETTENANLDIGKEIINMAMKPEEEFEGGLSEKLKTILTIAREAEKAMANDNDKVEEAGAGIENTEEQAEVEQTQDNASDKETLQNTLQAFLQEFNKFFNNGAVADNETVENNEEKVSEMEKKEINDKAIDTKIQKAIADERQNMAKSHEAYKKVAAYVGDFNMYENGKCMTSEEIYKYGYETLTGKAVNVADAKPSWEAYLAAKQVQDNAVVKTENNSENINKFLANFVK